MIVKVKDCVADCNWHDHAVQWAALKAPKSKEKGKNRKRKKGNRNRKQDVDVFVMEKEGSSILKTIW